LSLRRVELKIVKMGSQSFGFLPGQVGMKCTGEAKGAKNWIILKFRFGVSFIAGA